MVDECVGVIDFLTYSVCVQTGKKYIKGLDIDVQSRLNNSSNFEEIHNSNLQST